MIRAFLARDGKLRSRLGREEILSFLAAPSGVLWVDLESPEKAEIDLLSSVFRFHPLAVEDASKESDLPKATVYDGYVHLVLHRPARTVEERDGSPGELDVFLAESYVVTVHDAASLSASSVANLIASRPGMLEAGPDRIMYEILDRLVDRQMHLLDGYEDAIEDLEVQILGGEAGEEALERALNLRRGLAEMRKSLGPQRLLIETIAKRRIPHVTEALEPYLRDVMDHMDRIYQSLESHRDHIGSLFEATMAMSSNRLSHVMKRLTLIATIFLPLSFVAGVYGMNFSSIPGLDSPYGFHVVLGLMVTLAAGMLLYFKKRRLW